MLRIGYHVSISNGISSAFGMAHALGCTAMQIFPSNPRSWQANELSNEESNRYIRNSRKYDIAPVLIHMPYLPNFASPNDNVYKNSIEALRLAIATAKKIHEQYIVLHLGSHLGVGRGLGLKRIADAINGIDASDITLLFENEAGQRNSIGSKLEELADVYDATSGNRGFCLDTCHAFAAGYDIGKGSFADELGEKLGTKKVLAVHMNDAKYPIGSHLDRHENIGYGYIGIDGFRNFFASTRLYDRPIILETPTQRSGKAELALARSIIDNK